MTASTLSRSSSPFGKFVLLSLIVMMLLLAFVATASQHALVGHSEADQIIKCLNDNGPHLKLIYRSRDDKFYLPCLLDNGKIGLGIFTARGENISAYVPKDGTWSAVRNYIEQRAAHFTGKLPF